VSLESGLLRFARNDREEEQIAAAEASQ